MNCENLNFTQKLHDQRALQAESRLGAITVQKILGYALFLLGMPRSKISSSIGMPEGSVRSLILALNQRGLPAFEDQRTKTSLFKPSPPSMSTLTLEEHDSCLQVNFDGGHTLDIPASNTLQKRVFLLTLLNGGLLKCSEVAEALNLSPDRTGKLAKKLQQQDVDAISDQRRGQQQDYRFSPEVKAELIQQFVLDIMSDGKVSGEKLSARLNERCQLTLSPRSILYHVSALGLSRLKKTLPESLSELKKNL
jgi:hypothetical protein